VGVLVFFAIIIFFVVFVAQLSPTARQLRALKRLTRGGLPGRALVLSALQAKRGLTLGGQRYQQRNMTLEIEVDGREPYEVSGVFLVPRGLIDPVPGSSLDVAVDPRNPQTLVVLGPGGFSGPWLSTGIPAPY
jgi:hypothetical protein